jgi:peptidoglycan/LPS O-acetylase OafA/YrhL
MLRAGAGYRTVAISLVLAIAVLAGDRLRLTLVDASAHRIYYAPDGHFDVILVGCLAGLWFATGRVPSVLGLHRVQQLATVLALGVVTTVVALIAFGDSVLSGGLLTLFAAAVAVLILTVAVPQPSRLGRLLALPPLVFVGKISYALYLWHVVFLFALDALPATVEVGLAVVAATVSYYVVERPFLRWKRRDRAMIEARFDRPPNERRLVSAEGRATP